MWPRHQLIIGWKTMENPSKMKDGQLLDGFFSQLANYMEIIGWKNHLNLKLQNLVVSQDSATFKQYTC